MPSWHWQRDNFWQLPRAVGLLVSLAISPSQNQGVVCILQAGWRPPFWHRPCVLARGKRSDDVVLGLSNGGSTGPGGHACWRGHSPDTPRFAWPVSPTSLAQDGQASASPDTWHCGASGCGPIDAYSDQRVLLWRAKRTLQVASYPVFPPEKGPTTRGAIRPSHGQMNLLRSRMHSAVIGTVYPGVAYSGVEWGGRHTLLGRSRSA